MAQRARSKQQIEAAWRAEARRAGQARLRRPRPQPRSLSGAAIFYLLCIAMLVGWYAPTWRTLIEGRARPALTATSAYPPAAADTLSARFGFCHSGGGTNCVVDGDTFWFQGDKYRIADIDTPETHGPRCAAEGALGARATARLQALMNAGRFSLETGDRDTDRYGRALRVVTRGGRSVGATLVAEGLAREWDGSRHPWC